MNIIKNVIISVGLIAAGVFGATKVASAASAPLCVLDPLPMSQYSKSFTKNGSNVTAKFTLRGEANCKFDMTLFAFEAPAANGQPVKDQKLFSAASGTFGRGTHTLTTAFPACYHQLDIVTGKPIEAVKGTRYNDVVNFGNMVNQGRLGAGSGNQNAHVHDALIAGNKTCEQPEEPEVCPFDSSMKKDDPNCFEPCEYDPTMRADDEENCVPPTKETPVTPVSTPAELPNTGPAGVIAAAFGFSGIAGVGHNLVQRFKKRG